MTIQNTSRFLVAIVTLSFGASAYAADWHGTTSCGALQNSSDRNLNSNSKSRDPFAAPVILSITGKNAKLERVWTKGEERQEGDFTRGQPLRLIGFGYFHGRKASSWRTTSLLTEKAGRFEGTAVIESMDGKTRYRNCTLLLQAMPPGVPKVAVSKSSTEVEVDPKKVSPEKPKTDLPIHQNPERSLSPDFGSVRGSNKSQITIKTESQLTNPPQKEVNQKSTDLPRYIELEQGYECNLENQSKVVNRIFLRNGVFAEQWFSSADLSHAISTSVGRWKLVKVDHTDHIDYGDYTIREPSRSFFADRPTEMIVPSKSSRSIFYVFVSRKGKNEPEMYMSCSMGKQDGEGAKAMRKMANSLWNEMSDSRKEAAEYNKMTALQRAERDMVLLMTRIENNKIQGNECAYQIRMLGDIWDRGLKDITKAHASRGWVADKLYKNVSRIAKTQVLVPRKITSIPNSKECP